jgi:hypothetical protein
LVVKKRLLANAVPTGKAILLHACNCSFDCFFFVSFFLSWGGRPLPSEPGGGTVFYVTSDGHRYLENVENREEGGTPNILGAIRCGLVFRVQNQVGIENIAAVERQMTATALARLAAHPNIRLLGSIDLATAPRLPVWRTDKWMTLSEIFLTVAFFSFFFPFFFLFSPLSLKDCVVHDCAWS